MCFFQFLNDKIHNYVMLCLSEMTKFLDIFEDQKIDKMDINFCHDPQIVKMQKIISFIYLGWFQVQENTYTYIEYEIMKMNATINGT